MKPFSHPALTRSLQAGLLCAGLGLAAVAHAQAPHEMHAHRSERHAMHEKHAEKMVQRLASFKQKLAISAEQEAAWTAWTNALRANGPMQMADRAKVRAELAQLTTPERIDRMRAMRVQHQSRMDQRADATKAFYAQLNAEQRKLFDAETAKRMQHGPHMRGMRGMHGEGGEHAHAGHHG